MFQQKVFIFLCPVHGCLSATSSSHDSLTRPLLWLEPHLSQRPAWVMFWWKIWMYVSPSANKLKNALKPLETLSTSTHELHTPEYTIRTEHQWRRTMETDVDKCDLLLGKFYKGCNFCTIGLNLTIIRAIIMLSFSCFSITLIFITACLLRILVLQAYCRGTRLIETLWDCEFCI